MKTKFGVLAAIGLMAMTVASCGKKTEVAAEKPPVVNGARVDRVSMSPIEDYYEATGTVRSKTTTVLSSKIMGTVTGLRAGEGDRTRAGQVLIEIDDRDANAQLQKAEAGLRQAREGLAEVEQAINAAQSAQAAAGANQRLADSTYARYRALLERKSVSPQEFDEAKAKQEMAEAESRRAADTLKMLEAKKRQALAQIDQAVAEVANAKVYLSYARIASSISGVVVAKQTEVGSTATPGAPLLTIEDSSRYRLEVAVEESRLAKIGMGQRAREREEGAIVRLNQKLLANFDLIPPGASQPLVKPRSIDDVPILALTLSSDRYDHFTLRRVAAQVHDQIKEIGVDLGGAGIARIGSRRDRDPGNAGAHALGLLLPRLHAQPDHALRARLFHWHSCGRRHRRRREHRAPSPAA
jgi:multidrug efflux pump subunit AcrA (membrane-fusion protein)